MAMSSADRKKLQRERLKNGEKWVPAGLSIAERKAKSRLKVAAALSDVTNVTYQCASVNADGNHCRMLEPFYKKQPVLYNGFIICPSCAFSIDIGYSKFLVEGHKMLRTAGKRLS